MQVNFSHVRISQGSGVSPPNVDLITRRNTEPMHSILLETWRVLSRRAKAICAATSLQRGAPQSEPSRDKQQAAGSQAWGSHHRTHLGVTERQSIMSCRHLVQGTFRTVITLTSN